MNWYVGCPVGPHVDLSCQQQQKGKFNMPCNQARGSQHDFLFCIISNAEAEACKQFKELEPGEPQPDHYLSNHLHLFPHPSRNQDPATKGINTRIQGAQ